MVVAGAGPGAAGESPSPAGHADAVLPGRVTRVIDGDTIDVLLSSGRIRVRLHGIDAPERDQRWGSQSKSWLEQQLQDRDVELEPVSQDRYDRLVAIVHRDGTDINRELVRQGHAWAYRQYLRSADRKLCDLEHGARRAQRGLWDPQQAPAAAPWQFRATRGKGPFGDYSGSTARDCRQEIRKAAS